MLFALGFRRGVCDFIIEYARRVQQRRSS